MKKWLYWLTLAVVFPTLAYSQDKEKKEKDPPAAPPALAIFPFQERGVEVKGQGPKVSDILFAELVANPDVILVDREDLKKMIDEQELSLSGLVNPAEANKVGHLTGAKILVTGSILQTDKTVYVVAKLIGTETGRVLGASVKGAAQDKLDGMVTSLAEQVAKTLAERSSEILPKLISKEDRLATLKEKFPKGKRPSVFISVAERHVGAPTIDPAVETELMLWCKELGFEVLDPATAARSQADVVISGEGFSELAGRVGNLASVKARVELKAVKRADSEVITADREVTINVDLTEQIAGKKALQDAAVSLAERILPKLVGDEKEKEKKKK
jgi:TolB-like protein